MSTGAVRSGRNPADAPSASNSGSPEFPNDTSPVQAWTPSGYPIVDGKYLDLVDGTVKTVGPGPVTTGPPAIAVYIHNRFCTGQRGHFDTVVATSFAKDLTEYMIQVGELLRTGACKVDSLSATKYSVNLIVMTDLSSEEFGSILRQCRLLS